MSVLSKNYTLNNGVEIPKLGLGTWFIDDADAADAVRAAVATGYRHIDTAQAYGNERGVGEGVRTCGVPREQLFVVSKVAAEHKTYESAAKSIDETLEKMGLDFEGQYYVNPITGEAYDIDGKKVVVGGMAKGSGMIHPNMGTVLAFITSDIDIDQGLLQEALRYATNKSFNRISVDGQTSTNDMAIVLANGKAGNKKVTEKDANYDIFLQALVYICTELAKLVARDGEGATKLIECVVEGAKTEETAARLSKAVITSTMVKAAIFGSDANWGRILCAIGCEGSEFDPNKIDIIFESKKGYIEVCKDGEPLKFNEKKARSILEDDEITIIVDLQMGDARANAWGCDLTYEYVRINGSYRS